MRIPRCGQSHRKVARDLRARAGARPRRESPARAGCPGIDWSAWKPGQTATLLFVIRDGRILLIHKKRGLGAGKINGPGGRIEPGESPRAAAIREVREELLVTPLRVARAGELRFQFTDGLALHVHVFTAEGCDGEPRETGEAVPLWFDVRRIPYRRMWSDDPHWMPLMLKGVRFRGDFLFDGDRLLDGRVARVAKARAHGWHGDPSLRSG
jgi:8-oxo-dGTP diphosphatase